MATPPSAATKVLLLPVSPACANRPGKASILTLSHPRTGRSAQYLLLPVAPPTTTKAPEDDGTPPRMQLCELQAGTETIDNGAPVRQPASWFTGHRVCSDGALYLATPVDPLFVLLPVLDAARAKACPLAQLLDSAPRFPDLKALLRALPADPRASLAQLCAVNDRYGTDLLLYRLDERRALRWLIAKAAQFKAALAAHTVRSSAATAAAAAVAGEGGIDVALERSSHVATFKTSAGSRKTATTASPGMGGAGGAGAGAGAKEAADRRATREALALLSAYVPAAWVERVRKALNVGGSTPPAAAAGAVAGMGTTGGGGGSPGSFAYTHGVGGDGKRLLEPERESKNPLAAKRAKLEKSRQEHKLKKISTKGMKSMFSYFATGKK